jgi:signal transduction histidine kinase
MVQITQKQVFLKDYINNNLNAGKIYYIRLNLKQLNANSCRQGNHVVHGIVREFLASLPGSHQNTPAVADDLGPKAKLTTLVQNIK